MQSSIKAPFHHLVPDRQENVRIPREDLILCHFCHAGITTRHQELIISGGHQHRFINPSGTQFLIGCFRLAPGCDISGPATDEFSWFKDYAWQAAHCSDCGEHLGWLYQNGEANQFFGLIIDKLVRYQTR
ncbi:MAG TPA: cereblon family protein [Spongiibacteraceae bacterium]|nr:cereblon family protein [Spongiibacteraceae bacterium]